VPASLTVNYGSLIERKHVENRYSSPSTKNEKILQNLAESMHKGAVEMRRCSFRARYGRQLYPGKYHLIEPIIESKLRHYGSRVEIS